MPNKDKNVVDHINRIRNDNSAINLRWVSQKDNINNKSKINISFEKKNILDYYLNINNNDEEFKIINNSTYGDFSNYGRIKNNFNNKLLKPFITEEKYLMVSLSNKNIKKRINIHCLVCEFFNEKPKNNNDTVVNHINEIKYDNYYKNLEWVTISENNKHSKNTGCIPKQIKRNEKAYGYYWSINNKWFR